VSAKQRLDRLRSLREMAANLHRSILDECDMAQAEVAAIERQIAESDKRCEALEDMVTWDGEQPDEWLINPNIWRKAGSRDLGKLVRVSNELERNPAGLPQARLTGVGRDFSGLAVRNFFACEGSRGQRVEWKYAWIESNPCEEAEQNDDDGKGYISIQVGAFYPGEPSLPVVKQSLTTEE